MRFTLLVLCVGIPRRVVGGWRRKVDRSRCTRSRSIRYSSQHRLPGCRGHAAHSGSHQRGVQAAWNRTFAIDRFGAPEDIANDDVSRLGLCELDHRRRYSRWRNTSPRSTGLCRPISFPARSDEVREDARMTAKVFFATGTARGLGKQVADAVLAAGHFLVATARNPEQIRTLRETCGSRIITASLDVTDADAAQAAVGA